MWPPVPAGDARSALGTSKGVPTRAFPSSSFTQTDITADPAFFSLRTLNKVLVYPKTPVQCPFKADVRVGCGLNNSHVEVELRAPIPPRGLFPFPCPELIHSPWGTAGGGRRWLHTKVCHTRGFSRPFPAEEVPVAAEAVACAFLPAMAISRCSILTCLVFLWCFFFF